VVRPHDAVETRVLPPGGHAFADALRRGARLAAAVEAAARAAEGFDLAFHLSGLFQIGAVIAVHSDPDHGERRP
jgi:hypothetical protein